MLSCCFAVSADGHHTPEALFTDVEDAISFGLEKFGSEGFKIRHCPVMELVLECPPKGTRLGEQDDSP
jgi:hypothetical protein